MSRPRLYLCTCLIHPFITLALKWFDGDGNAAEEYEGGRELEDFIKLSVAFIHPPSHLC